MAGVCLTVTKPIRELAKKMNGESAIAVANLISLYNQDKKIYDLDHIPSVDELKAFRDELRKPENYEFGFIDFGERYDTLLTLEKKKQITVMAKNLGVELSRNGNRLELKSKGATSNDMLLFKYLVADLFFSNENVESIFGDKQNGKVANKQINGQKRLDFYINWLSEEKKNSKTSNINAVYPLIAQARQNMRGVVDTRTSYEKQFDIMSSKLNPTTRDGLVEGMATWFSRMWDNNYQNYLKNIKTRLDALKDIEGKTPSQMHEEAILAEELETTRDEFIRQPGKINEIFDEIQQRFVEYASMNSDELKQRLQKDFDDKRLLTDSYIKNNFMPMFKASLECFDVLADKVCARLETTELITIRRNVQLVEALDNIEQKESEDPESQFDDDDKLLEGFKENWMYEANTVSNYSKLPVQVRNLLSNCPMTSRTGAQLITPLGTKKMLPVNTVLPELLEGLHGIKDSRDVIPALLAMTKDCPWVSTIISELSKDPNLKTMFYNNMNRARKAYGIFTYSPDGTIKMDIVNRANRTSSVAQRLKNIIASSNVLTESNPVYLSNGRVNRTNVNARRNSIDKIETLLNSKKAHEINVVAGQSNEEMVKFLTENPTIIPSIVDHCLAIGMDTDANDIKQTLFANPVVTMSSNNLVPLVHAISEYYKHIAEDKDISTVNDLLKKLSYDINDIAKMFKNVDTTLVEKSVRQNGKTRYSYTLKSDIDTIIEGLRSERFDTTSEESLTRRNIGAQGFVKEKYGEDSYYYNKASGRYMSLWLDDLEADGSLDIDYVEILDYTDEKDKTTEFDTWSNDLRVKMHYSMYGRKNDYTGDIENWYPIPVTSDVQTARYIKAPSYTYKKIVKGFQTVIMQEISRMTETKSLFGMPKTYRDNADKFCMLPFFNNYEGKTGREVADELMDLRNSEPGKFYEKLQKMAKDYLDNEIDTYIENNKQFVKNLLNVDESIDNIKSFVKNIDTIDFNGRYSKGAFSHLRNYIVNSSYAQSQMISLFIGDPANFENYTDLQKRFKQIIVPKESIDEFNEYAREITTNEGQIEGEGLQESCLYLDDVSSQSNSIVRMKNMYKNKLDSGEILPDTYNAIMKEFGNIKFTDGQAYRTPNGFKKILYMRGLMKKNDALDIALSNVFSGKSTEKDFDVIRKAQNSFVLKPFTSGLTMIDAGGGIKKLIPIQHKNSEQLLSAALECAAMSLGQSGILSGLAQYCQKHDIDVVMFNSAVKVGNTGFVEWKDTKDGKTIDINTDKITTEEAVDFLERNAHLGTHYIPYSMYGTVSSVPEHGIDKTINIGTQLQKLIAADIPEGAKFNFDGKKISKKQMIASYNAIYTEKIRRAYTEITGMFADTEKLSKKLHAAVLASSRGSQLLERAFSLDEFGNFIIPLCDLSTINLSSEFLNSIVRKAVSKIEIDGGQFVQMSPFGLSDKLNVVFETKNGKRRVKYIECYLPEYTRQLEVFADMDGVIHPEDVPEELMQALGVRIPTEGKYFMAPLKIKGFLPALMPTSAIFPKDIVALTDSDFDVDKEPTILPTFRFKKYDFKRARKDYDNLDEVKNELEIRKKEKRHGLVPGSLVEKPARRFGQWFKEVMDKYRNPSSEAYMKNDTANNVGGMTDDELNDKLLEAMYAMLTSPDVVDQVATAGDIGPAKAVANEIKALKGLTNEVMSPASINTVITQTERNNAGKNMIAVGAVANAMHAIEQHIVDKDRDINFKINESYRFSINGYSNTSMTNIVSRDKQTLISKNIGVCLGAAADNAKSPTLYYLNINTNTCNAAYLMLRLGYTPMDVGLFLNIPAVLEYSRTGITPAYVKGLEDKSSYDLPGDEEKMRNVVSGKKDGKEYHDYAYEAQALRIFKLLQEKIGKDMHTLDMLCRNDSGSSAPHGALESNITRQLKYYDYMYSPTVNHYFDNWYELFSDDEFDYAVENSMIPIAQAITSYSTFGAYEQMKSFFPGMKSERFLPMMYSLIKRCYGGYITERNVRTILYSLYAYNASGMSSLATVEGNVEKTRKWYMDNTPGEDNFTNFAKKVIASNPRLRKLSFISNLKFGDDTDGTPFISLNYEGSMIPSVRDQFISEWAQMFHASDPDIVKFAQHLFNYSIYRNGSQYTNGSFAHLAPIEARLMNPGYIDELNEIVDNGKVTGDESRFMIQFVRNNLNNKRMCRMLQPRLVGNGYWKDKDTKATLDSFVVESDQEGYVDFQHLAENGSGCFKVVVNKKLEYYIAVRNGTDKNGNTTYLWQRTTPLGWGGKAYEFNSMLDGFKVESVYNNEKVNSNLNGKKSAAGDPGSDAPDFFPSLDDIFDVEVVDAQTAESVATQTNPSSSIDNLTKDEEKALIEKIRNSRPGDPITPDMLQYMTVHPELFLDPNKLYKDKKNNPLC